MHISLIGMSNIGKTYCAKNLARHHGYKHIDCDAIIEQKLGEELFKLGFLGIHGVARWMGFPSEPSYNENSRRYMACEKQAMTDALELMRKEKDKPIVLDTTGSVIYLDNDILSALRAETRVIYFEATEKQTSALFSTFLNHPKPVIWEQQYAPLPGEKPRETLKRCYPLLLKDRAKRYKEISHITIPFDLIKDRWSHIGDFVLKAIMP